MPFDFGDFLGMTLGAADEIALDNAEEVKLLAGSPSVMMSDPTEMTEREALDIYDTAETMGIGSEVDLSEAVGIKRQALENESLAIADDLIEDVPGGSPMPLKNRKDQPVSKFSSVSERQKCPFEQWMKDICAGRKTINDSVVGERSYGKCKY